MPRSPVWSPLSVFPMRSISLSPSVLPRALTHRRLVGYALTCWSLVASGAAAAQRAPTPTAPLQSCLDSLGMIRYSTRARFLLVDLEQDPATADSLRSLLRGTAQRCLTRVTSLAVPTAQWGTVATLQAEAGQYPQSLATYQRYLTVATISPARRAAALEAALPALITDTAAAALQELRALVPLADGVPGLRVRSEVRLALARADRHTAAPEESYGHLREALTAAGGACGCRDAHPAGSGRHDNSRHWRSAGAPPISSPRVPESLVVLARQGFAHVPQFLCGLGACEGVQAPPLEAQQWLNVPAGKPLPQFGDGHVYLLEFTALWCIPCHLSYPMLVTLARQYAPHGLRILLVTALYGQGVGDRPMPPREEFEALRTFYVKKDHLPFPIAVDGDLHALAGTDQGHGVTKRNHDLDNYAVTELPSFVLIDRTGIVRHLWHGLGETAVLSDSIAAVLQEASARGPKP